MSEITQKIHKSKYGYHPTSYEDMIELKEAHKLLFRALRDIRKYYRWHNKLIRSVEPPYPGKYANWIYKYRKGGYKYILDVKKSKYTELINHKIDNISYYELILKWYRLARKPVESQDQITDEIDMQLVKKIRSDLEYYYFSLESCS